MGTSFFGRCLNLGRKTLRRLFRHGDAASFGRPGVASAEAPLTVFVSSRMYSARDSVLRERAVNTIRSLGLGRDWTFEFTPASPINAIEAYETAVKTADVVLYIATETISDAVKREVYLALKSGVPVIAIDANVQNTPDDVGKFFIEVQPYIKYKKISRDEEFESEVKLALGDVLIRSLRRAAPSRRFILDHMHRESIARITVGFEAPGIPPELAAKLANDPAVGARFEIILPTPLAILEGDVGVGKTLFGERWLCRAITRASEDESAPIPYYVKASKITARSISQQIAEHSKAVGDWLEHGVALFVDGLDEPGVRSSAEIIEELQVIARLVPKSAILVTIRPSYFAHAGQYVRLQPLSLADAHYVVQLIARREVPRAVLSDLEESVRQTICQPLFAILFGVLLSEHTSSDFIEQTSLLDALVERALGRADADSIAAHTALRELAVATLMQGREAGYSGNISRRVRGAILRSRLAREDYDGTLNFTLPALIDWFGSEAIADGDAPLQQLLASESQTYNWRYPLSIAITKSTPDRADLVLSELFSRRPASAARILIDGLSQYGRRPVGFLPDAEEARVRLQSAYEAVQSALGRLRRFSMREIDGKVLEIEVYTRGTHLEVNYISPTGARLGEPGAGIHAVSSVDPRSGWAYRFALDEAREQLFQALDRRTLWLDEGPELVEWHWWLVGQYADEQGIVNVEELKSTLARTDPGHRLLDRGCTVGDVIDVCDDLLAEGNVSYRDLYPAPLLWQKTVLSDDDRTAIAERVMSIYHNAVEIYSQIVGQWIPDLIQAALNTKRLFPVDIEIILSNGFVSPKEIWARYRMTPLIDTDGTTIRVSVGTWSSDKELDEWRRIWENAKSLRGLPPVQPQLGYRLIRPFADRPATTLAYGWLHEDLKILEWSR